jgi:hypothetical protein
MNITPHFIFEKSLDPSSLELHDGNTIIPNPWYVKAKQGNDEPYPSGQQKPLPTCVKRPGARPRVHQDAERMKSRDFSKSEACNSTYGGISIEKYSGSFSSYWPGGALMEFQGYVLDGGGEVA